MELNGIEVFGGGILGFVLLEAVKFGRYHIAGNPFAPKYKMLSYWAGFICLCLVSGSVAIMNGVEKVPLERAMQLGIVAPAILSGLATSYKAEKEKRISMNMNAGKSNISQNSSFLDKIFSSFAWE